MFKARQNWPKQLGANTICIQKYKRNNGKVSQENCPIKHAVAHHVSRERAAVTGRGGASPKTSSFSSRTPLRCWMLTPERKKSTHRVYVLCKLIFGAVSEYRLLHEQKGQRSGIQSPWLISKLLRLRREVTDSAGIPILIFNDCTRSALPGGFGALPGAREQEHPCAGMSVPYVV